MIFVTVGNDFRSFDRLLKKMDEIAPFLPDEVVIQRGYSRYRPLNTDSFDFVPMEKAIEYLRGARLVVSHAGIGTIMLCKEYGIPILILPRRKRYQEHMNDHQMEIARELEKRGDESVDVLFEEESLKEKILDILKRERNETRYENLGRLTLIHTIRVFLQTTWP
jgi:UDP-N-acetylglucosamine transferase subunit ALG13